MRRSSVPSEIDLSEEDVREGVSREEERREDFVPDLGQDGPHHDNESDSNC